jgi:hypothetical protein
LPSFSSSSSSYSCLAGPSSAFSLSSDPELLDPAKLTLALFPEASWTKLAFLEGLLLLKGCTLLPKSISKFDVDGPLAVLT